MSEWIFINGARIERSFFEENIKEAIGYEWTAINIDTLHEHVHCMICFIAIDPTASITAYKSDGGFVCTYCFENFLKSGNEGVASRESII